MPRRRPPPKVYAIVHDCFRGVQASKYGNVSYSWWLRDATDLEKDATMIALKRVLRNERKAAKEAADNPDADDDEDEDDEEEG